MKTLTVFVTTSRNEPHLDWVYDSLVNQAPEDDLKKIDIVCVSLKDVFQPLVRVVKPKPNVWQGKHRLTKEDWWAVCNARNTALCICNTEWIAFVDDRCVITDGWLNSVKEAMNAKYIVAGAYEKRHGMKVKKGVITHGGIVTAKDSREEQVKQAGAINCPGAWLFGCCLALPTEWAIRVNGWPELLCDSLSFEDVIFGIILQNNHYPIRFDKRMKIIEDRTPEECGPVMKRTDKGVSPKDKSHAALHKAQSGMKRSENPFGDIRELRRKIQNGEPFPILNIPKTDWFDGQPVSDF